MKGGYSLKSNIFKILNIFLIVTGLIILGAILIWSPVCEGLLQLSDGREVHMKCYYTAQASVLLSIILIVSCIESLIKKFSHPLTTIAIGITMIANTFTSKFGIGICMKETMSCNNTALWIRGGGIAVIICGLIFLFMGQRNLVSDKQ